MALNLPLMKNNINRHDLDSVIEFLSQDDPILTQSSNVKAFEEEWSKWLGIKYSVFVNSGSSANLLTMDALSLIFPQGGEVIVPPLTWISDITAVIKSGFTPVFVDIDPDHLGMDSNKIIESLNNKTRAVFLTHIQGFNALTNELLSELKKKNIFLIEDVCESHGATHEGKKLGTFGWASNFSFYYAHHMSTIEGGMVCTDDEDVYQNLRMLRSHGMVRESTSEKLKSKFVKDYPDLNPQFIFAFPAYNMRSTEINAVLGRSQLKRLDENNKSRKINHDIFLENLSNIRYKTNFRVEGSCNYAFNLVLKDPDVGFVEKLIKKLIEEKVEFRRGSAGGGNQLRQPYLRKMYGVDYKNYPVVEHIHFFGFYIGNYPDLDKNSIMSLCKVLNNV
ncbi:MAG: CDP-4-keto-6-deoxy-D-glucose-3-dehydrase [Betaproteobacteria bacterium TMED156]|nr:MAG: CDP-4-keto-6-deoxy-D-glucose-3-dehydrase [Betaproteobacteria bacterium TMED156]